MQYVSNNVFLNILMYFIYVYFFPNDFSFLIIAAIRCLYTYYYVYNNNKQ